MRQLDERCVLTSVTVWQVPGWFNVWSDRPGCAVLIRPHDQGGLITWAELAVSRFVVIGAFSLN